MRILYSAFACDPNKGSEAQCGWSWGEAMSKYHDVHVLTRKENRESIESYMHQHELNICIHYCDVPDWINFFKKTGKFYSLYYCIWQRAAYREASKLQKDIYFDVIHHVSLGDLRVIGSLWRLDAKFVFGPCGGGQTTPHVLEPYIANHKKEEKKREFVNAVFLRNPLYRKGINKAYKVYAANKETQLALQKTMKRPERCELLTEIGVSENFINNLKPRMEYNSNGEVVLLWAGRMVYRKGLEFLLDVIDMVDSNRKWSLKLVGDGIEKEVLINKCKTIKNGDKVHFIEKVSYDGMRELYASSDVFVFPSLRETTGSVICEAMANQIPVVSFMQNGVGLIVDDETGILVPLTDNLDEVKLNFCRAIENLIENDSLRMQMGVNAKNKILNNYLWSEKVKKIEY